MNQTPTSEKSTYITVVIPFYQKKPGLLYKSLKSVADQTIKSPIHVIIVDDESPVSAEKELENLSDYPKEKITLIKQKNGGAGSARNTALDAVPENTQFVAFLDSDDTWLPHHLETALNALQKGYDAYFSDWWSFNFPETTNFKRIKTLKPENHQKVEGIENVYLLGMTPIEHILSDGGGLIQTSTVVYNFKKYPDLRFREEFFNGQDFFFWMDLGELGAEFIFSTELGCRNGEGINIYQGSGWGSEHSLRRIRNELFVWTSTEKFYSLSDKLTQLNRQTIYNLQENFIRDIIHRIRHRKKIDFKLFKDIIYMTPSSLFLFVTVPIKIIYNKFFSI